MTVTYDATHHGYYRCNPCRDSCVTYVVNSDTLSSTRILAGQRHLLLAPALQALASVLGEAVHAVRKLPALQLAVRKRTGQTGE
jgi:hypothetical protein